MTTTDPLAKHALHLLGDQWPEPLRFTDLLTRARARLQAPGGRLASVEADALDLGKLLLQAYASGLVELHTYVPAYARKAGERPMASPMARFQARHGDFVTSLYHTSMSVEDAMARQLLLLLDGTRDRAALLEALLTLADEEAAARRPDDRPRVDPAQARILLAGELEKNLNKLARMGLLLS